MIVNLRLQQEVSNRDRERGAPCRRACPAEIDIPRCHRLISLGKFNEALAVYREKVPFPAVLGCVCPAPCEIQCRMSEMGDPLAIRALKRLAAEKAVKPPSLPVPKPTGKKVAVVGSGPAGLTAAYYLARQGYTVTVLEAASEPGGMMRMAIPEYRLPKNILNAEIAVIESAGVEIKTNNRVTSLESLFKKGYDAVFLAIGASKGIKLGIAGEDSPRVIDCISLLKDINAGKEVKLGNRVAVIGGGNAAIDSARAALRLGAKEVTIIYRRTRAEMPASPDEIEEALAEGVTIEFLAAPSKITSKGDSVELESIRMKQGAVEADGRRRPEPIKGSEFSRSFDNVIAAIGQLPEISKELGLPTNPTGTIQIVSDTLATSKKGVFAGGDAVKGPALVIQAIADGRQAAISIDKYLGGKGVIDEVLTTPEIEVRPQVPLSLSIDRAVLLLLPVAERLAGFGQVELSLVEEAAMGEAKRCLWCDLELVANAEKCAQCHTCQLVCSLAYTQAFNLSKARIIIGTGIGVEGEEPKFTDECTHCNLCARYCAYDAIALRKGGK